MADGLRGLAEAYRFLDAAPEAAREELAVEMAAIGYEVLVGQKADAPKKTGALAADLTVALLLERLRVRVGLIAGSREASSFNGKKRKARDGGEFYGRIVEFGRKRQVVVVTRRVKKRRVSGNGRKGPRRVIYQGASSRLRRRGPNKGTPIGSPYRMRVKAMQARPFVEQPLLQEAADQHLADYWSRVIARMGGA